MGIGGGSSSNDGGGGGDSGSERPPPPDVAAAEAEGAERFSRGVSDLLVAVEELRGDCCCCLGRDDGGQRQREDVVTTDRVVRWQGDFVERMLMILDALARWSDDAPDDDLRRDMFSHCHLKATAACQLALCRAIDDYVEPDDDDYTDTDAGGDDPTPPPPGGGVPAEALRQDGQRAVARLAEVNLLMLENARSRGIDVVASASSSLSIEISDPSEIVRMYTSYQRQVLRLRAKAPIARLVQARREGIGGDLRTTSAGSATAAAVVVHHHDDDDDDDGVGGGGGGAGYQPPLYVQHHAPVVAAILGQAAALIHPLLTWRAALPPEATAPDGCEGMAGWIAKLTSGSIEKLDEQAQNLVGTVSGWYWEDRPAIEDWMKRGAMVGAGGGGDGCWLQRPELGILDGLVEEIAFGCQVQARYQALVTQPCQDSVKIQTTIERELLPEWTWKYSALERFLAMQQLHSALELASPVRIVVGSDVCVPSVVEDAQYLSTRALERAASTQSTQATGTVAHAVSHDVWSTEADAVGVHRALLERRGCWQDGSTDDDDGDPAKGARAVVDEAPKSSSAFASALLDALDDDLGPDAGAAASSSSSNAATKSKNARKPPSAPTSGNFLANLVSGSGGDKMERMHLETEFCAMNGMHAACTACRSLVSFLDSLLASDDEDQGSFGNNGEAGQRAPPASGSSSDDKATAMIQLAREELFRHAEAYREMLMAHIRESLESSCGSMSEAVALRGLCFHDLYAFLESERYDIDANEMAVAEADERLDRELIEPLRTSRFLNELCQKCEADVLQQVGDVVVEMLVTLFLEILWKTGKKVSDWGSLLLSKQVRLIQAHVNRILTPADATAASSVPINLFQKWERLSQVLTVLQLEKPSDWLAYTNSSLTPDELRSTLSLRVDFSTDAIQAVVSQVSKTAEAGKAP